MERVARERERKRETVGGKKDDVGIGEGWMFAGRAKNQLSRTE